MYMLKATAGVSPKLLAAASLIALTIPRGLAVAVRHASILSPLPPAWIAAWLSKAVRFCENALQRQASATLAKEKAKNLSCSHFGKASRQRSTSGRQWPNLAASRWSQISWKVSNAGPPSVKDPTLADRVDGTGPAACHTAAPGRAWQP